MRKRTLCWHLGCGTPCHRKCIYTPLPFFGFSPPSEDLFVSAGFCLISPLTFFPHGECSCSFYSSDLMLCICLVWLKFIIASLKAPFYNRGWIFFKLSNQVITVSPMLQNSKYLLISTDAVLFGDLNCNIWTKMNGHTAAYCTEVWESVDHSTSLYATVVLRNKGPLVGSS